MVSFLVDLVLDDISLVIYPARTTPNLGDTSTDIYPGNLFANHLLRLTYIHYPWNQCVLEMQTACIEDDGKDDDEGVDQKIDEACAEHNSSNAVHICFISETVFAQPGKKVTRR